MTRVLPFHQVYLELTNACNCACHFCPQPKMIRPISHMGPGLAKRLISEIHGLRLSERIAFHVVGEPSLYAGFFDILGFASGLSLRTSLVTNGMLLDDDFGAQLRTRMVDELTLSVQTPDRRSFAFRDAPVSFDQYKQGILRFIADTYASPSWAGSDYVIRFLSTCLIEKAKGLTSLYGDACSDFSALRAAMEVWVRELYTALGVEGNKAVEALLRLRGIQLAGFNRMDIYPRIRFDVWHMLDWMDWTVPHDGPVVRTGDCLHRKNEIAILSNGDVVVCCLDFNGRTTLGNVRNMMLMDVLKGDMAQHVLSEFEQGRVALPFCRRCMGSWREQLRALSHGATLATTHEEICAILQNQCSIWERDSSPDTHGHG